MSNTKKSNSIPLITSKAKQIETETNNNKTSNINYNIYSFTNKKEEESIEDPVPMLAWCNNTDNIDSGNDGNDNKRGKIMLELRKYPRGNTNATSDVDKNNEDKDVECSGIINKCDFDSDSDDEKEENKVDQTPIEAIKKSINMISCFLNRRKRSIF